MLQKLAAIMAQADPNAPVDLSNSIVVGTADTYVGGTTSEQGTSTRAVVVAGASGSAAPTPAAPPATGPDRSQRAVLAGGASWSCPFPAEADSAQIDHAVVTMRISVDARGTPGAVVVTLDPGHGFGREARACVAGKRFESARDRTGAPIEGAALVNVRFDR